MYKWKLTFRKTRHSKFKHKTFSTYNSIFINFFDSLLHMSQVFGGEGLVHCWIHHCLQPAWSTFETQWNFPQDQSHTSPADILLQPTLWGVSETLIGLCLLQPSVTFRHLQFAAFCSHSHLSFYSRLSMLPSGPKPVGPLQGRYDSYSTICVQPATFST